MGALMDHRRGLLQFQSTSAPTKERKVFGPLETPRSRTQVDGRGNLHYALF